MSYHVYHFHDGKVRYLGIGVPSVNYYRGTFKLFVNNNGKDDSFVASTMDRVVYNNTVWLLEEDEVEARKIFIEHFEKENEKLVNKWYRNNRYIISLVTGYKEE